MCTVYDIVNEIEKIAKPQYAFDWDNCGLLVGNSDSKVENLLVTLDITKDVVLEAIKKKCQMIVSHHPLIFKAIKNLNTHTYEGEVVSLLYKYDIALYCAHTSLDSAHGGVNDALCKKLELENVEVMAPSLIEGEYVSCVRCGELKKSLNKNELLTFIKEKTEAKNLLYYLEDKEYKKVALCTGAGEEFAFEINSFDVFVTGEVKYHNALELKRQNISFIAAGHYYTEVHIIKHLAACLQNAFNVLQYDVNVFPSETNTNPFEN